VFRKEVSHEYAAFEKILIEPANANHEPLAVELEMP
jgi:hypothetical protein